MNDKELKDRYLTAESEEFEQFPAPTAGWSAVSSSLKRRARVRKIVYTASSTLSVATIAALLYIGLRPASPETRDTPLLASAESKENFNGASGEAEVIVPSATGVNLESGESPAIGGQLYGVKVANRDGVNYSTAVTEASGSNSTDSGETKPEVDISSKGSESTTTNTLFVSDNTAVLDDYYAEATLQEKISKRQKISAYLAVNGIPGTKGGINGSRASATTFKASPLGASLMQSSGIESNTIDTGRYEDAQFKHSAPIGAELVLNIPLWRRSGSTGDPGGLSIESGVSYSYLRSQLLFQGHVKADEQRVQYVGIPLRIRYSFGSNSAFSTYVSAGGKLEWAMDARVAGNKVSEKGVQISIGANAGVQWKAADHIYIYAQPEISYYLTESRLKTIRTDSPLNVGLSIGLGFSL